MSLRDTFRRDQVFAPLRPGTRPVRPGQLDTGGKHILYMEDITVSFDGFKALNDLTLYIKPGELRPAARFSVIVPRMRWGSFWLPSMAICHVLWRIAGFV